jgi:hypothetical protein
MMQLGEHYVPKPRHKREDPKAVHTV